MIAVAAAEMDIVKSNTKMVLYVAGGEGVKSSQFMSEYREITGQKLNLESLGFDNLEDLMRSIPDVVHIEKDTHTSEIIFVAKEHAVHWMSDEERDEEENNTVHNQSEEDEEIIQSDEE